MSTTYPQFPYSSFPEQIDNFPDAQDVSAELLPLVKQYKALFNSGEYAACQKLLADHPQLKAAQSSALSANQVYDAIGALQTLFKTDIEQYLDGRVPQRIVLSETEPSGLAENDVWLQVVDSSEENRLIVLFKIRNADASYDTVRLGSDCVEGLRGEPLEINGTQSIHAKAGKDRIESIALYGKTMQKGSGDPSPDNIRELVPIGCQANLLQNTATSITQNGVTFIINPNKSITCTGTSTDIIFLTINMQIPNLANKIVTISGRNTAPTGVGLSLSEQSSNGWVRNIMVDTANGVSGFISVAAGNFVGSSLSIPRGTQMDCTIYPMLNYGSVAAPYVPYTGIPYGTQIVVNGERTLLPLTEALWEGDTVESSILSEFDCKVILDGSDAEEWIYSSYRNGMRAFIDLPVASYKKYTVASGYIPQGDVLEDRFVCCFNPDMLSRFQVIAATEYFNKLGITNVAEWKSYLAAHPLTVWYKSAMGRQNTCISRESHIRSQLVLKGTENWSVGSALADTYMFYLSLSSNIASNDVLCSHFANVSNIVNTDTEGICVDVSANVLYIRIKRNRLTADSADSLNAYLAAQHATGTPVTVVYELAEPEIYTHEPITVPNPTGNVTISGESALTVSFRPVGDMSTVLYDPSHTGKVLYAVKADVLGDKGAESFATAAQGKTADELVSGVIPAAKAAQLATVRKIGSADFDGSADVTLAQMGAEPTFAKNDAFNKAFGTAAGTVCQGNDSRLSNARRASNISMSLSGTTLTISYS